MPKINIRNNWIKSLWKVCKYIQSFFEYVFGTCAKLPISQLQLLLNYHYGYIFKAVLVCYHSGHVIYCLLLYFFAVSKCIMKNNILVHFRKDWPTALTIATVVGVVSAVLLILTICVICKRLHSRYVSTPTNQ